VSVSVVLLGSTFNTTSGTHTVTATPAVNDIIVIVYANTTSTSGVVPTDNNSDGFGGTFGYGAGTSNKSKNSSADELGISYRTNPIGSATSTVFTQAPGTTTGGGLSVYAIRGAPAGSTFLLRGGGQSNQASGGTPAPILNSSIDTGYTVIGAIFNATSPATMTPRTGYTEGIDVGYSTPTTGLETIYIASGETSTTITWGGTSASAFASIAMALKVDAPPTVALNTPADTATGVSTTPDLAFTGTDADADTIEYEVQVDTVNTFNSVGGNPLLDKLSVTPDATFTDVTNGAHTHPFVSGEQVKYTVQAGNILTANTTYYWRVRGLDPSGTNTYGAWSATRSFTTASGSIPNKIYNINQAINRSGTY
jgi:hypothetical protein